MSRAVTNGISTGSSLALVWHLLEHFQPQQLAPPLLYCSGPRWYELHWQSLVLGIFLGLLLGPLLEGISAARAYLFQAAVRRSCEWLGKGSPLYRLA